MTPAAEDAPLALRADLLDFAGEPAWGQARPDDAVRWRPDHWLLVRDGRIEGALPGDQAPPAHYRREDHRGRLLMPGFVDTHVHSPQLEVVASHGTALLDWLRNYTFPAELAWADPEVARAGSERFCDQLLAHGTTAACVYPTVHKVSADALFQAAHARGMRVVGGKCLMDRHAPDGLRDSVAEAERDCTDLIDRWHGRGRASYAVTVRFAPTSTPAQLAMAGALCRADPTLYLQTHVAENTDELLWVAELFPEARSYLDVYARAGLVHRRSLLAHGIWLDDHDRALVAEAGAVIAHCPGSNLFLGSGLFDWHRARAADVSVALASDVGGGPELSMLSAMADAYRVQALHGRRLTAWTLLHAATRGAARALQLEHEIGSLEPGRVADLCLWDRDDPAVVAPMLRRRTERAVDLHEALFAWILLAEPRALHSAWVAGRARYRRAP